MLVPKPTCTDLLLQLRKSREYSALREALVRGGLTEEALQLLVEEPGNLAAESSVTAAAKTARSSGSINIPPDNARGGGDRMGQSTNDNATSCKETSGHRTVMAPALRNGSPAAHLTPTARSPNPRAELSTSIGVDNSVDTQRTLRLSDLPHGVTYHEVLSVVRGGRIVTMQLKREATITFWTGAREFLFWAKRNGLVIRGHCVR